MVLKVSKNTQSTPLIPNNKKSDINLRVKSHVKKDDVFDIDNDIHYEIAKGFDRGIDYLPIKNKFINEYNKLFDQIKLLEDGGFENIRKITMIKKKILYLLVAMIQLRNGSRISEACNALKYFNYKDNYNEKIIVKIAKSEAIKYKNGEKIVTKPRFRKMIFPIDWLINFNSNIIKDAFCYVPFDKLKKRVLDFLLKNYKCNTHSLRYACINYLIYDMKRPLNDVAKFVGHVDLSMLTKYTQQKNCEKIFDLDM